MDVDHFKARDIVLRNDIFSSLEVAVHYLATMACQKKPSERPADEIEQDWEDAFEIAVSLARETVEKMKVFQPDRPTP